MPLPHHLAAVWFADIVGYTSQSDSDEAVAQRLVQVFTASTKDVVARYGGRVVKFLGDGALVEFPSTELAVRSAWRSRPLSHERRGRKGSGNPAFASECMSEMWPKARTATSSAMESTLHPVSRAWRMQGKFG